MPLKHKMFYCIGCFNKFYLSVYILPFGGLYKDLYNKVLTIRFS